MRQTIIFIIILFLLNSCNSTNKESIVKQFEISDFKTLTNYNLENDTLKMNLSLQNAIIDGFTIPEDGNYFHFSFKIKNSSNKPTSYYYKIYYQNESYKHIEEINIKGRKKYNLMAGENFYGSWEQEKIEFKKTYEIPNDGNYHLITDSFRIVGNPRNETKYFGAKPENINLSDKRIAKIKSDIRKNEAWMEKIKAKAEKNNLSIEDQLYEDAIWVVEDESKKGSENNRWKRNPRMGDYKFMLVVADEVEIGRIPKNLKNIGIKSDEYGSFLNPFYYFKKPEMNKNEGLNILVSNNILKVKASLNPESGIYISQLKYKKTLSQSPYFNEYYGNTEKHFANSHFEQFFHNINRNFPLTNIPVVEDVSDGTYSAEDYYNNLKKYKENDLITDYVKISENPGKTVGFDELEKALFFFVPGNKSNNNPVKENVGVKTRIGFTYGKVRAKVKFPDMINKENVWNGLTYAVWLLTQDLAEWNKRNVCVGDGYIPKHQVGKTDVREATNSYSEIDIEIVKTAKYWPDASYKDLSIKPKDNSAENHNLIFTGTNWDLACNEPSKFSQGVREIEWNKQKFHVHRWDKWYKALTFKTELPHDETVGTVLWYEIDWQPDKIIWRIGPDKENMKIVGYMDSTFTKIPNNQMIMVITQEFHDAQWWPTAPFDQNYIPFPKSDIKGYLYEIEIE
ncbi:MAG: hypothetical protein JXR58_05265 [Bacteroidales bacterium]|nr:hypothetical protein [Bacteroidales bacterium]